MPRKAQKPQPANKAAKKPPPINVAQQLDDIERKVDQDYKIDKQALAYGASHEERLTAIEDRLVAIEEKLDAILEIFTEVAGKASSLNLRLGPPAVNTPGGDMATKDLGVNQNADATINPLDADGNPAQIEAGSTQWAVSDPTLAEVTSIDDKNANVRNLGVVGTYELTVSADADLGEGVTTITDALTINAVPGEAVNLGLSLGEPKPNEPAPTA